MGGLLGGDGDVSMSGRNMLVVGALIVSKTRG